MLESGLIPARAGNTGFQALCLLLIGAHPRSRGEHMGYIRERQASSGSSPLARGTPEELTNGGGLNGLIPARAGNTFCQGGPPGSGGAHPRSRGEHYPYKDSDPDYEGSSPLARGTHPNHDLKSLRYGLIPARAGNTPGFR